MTDPKAPAAPNQDAAPVDFDIPIIAEALGHSIIYEEYKGDFALARQLAQAAVEATATREDSQAQADAHIALGLVQILQGDLLAAPKTLEEVDRLCPEDADRCYSAFALGNMAAMYRYRLAPAGGLFTLELEQLWNGIEFAGNQEERLTELRPRSESPSVQMQAALIFHVLSMLPVHRQMLENRSSIPPDRKLEFLRVILSSATNFRGVAVSSGTRPRIIAYIDLLAADVARRAECFDVAQQALAGAHQSYQADGDRAGAACCQMMWGDWLSAPASSPEIWNFTLKEGSGDGSNLSWIEEAREFQFEERAIPQAEQVWELAAEQFRDAGAARGLARLQIRLAYLAVLRGEFQSAHDMLDEALAMAEQKGDTLLAQLARVAKALAAVGMSHRLEDHATMRQVGGWGASSGSLAYAGGLALFVGRAARHWLLRRGDYERSAACYRMARTLFGSAGMPLHEAQSLIDLGNLYASAGERYSAITTLEEASAVQRAASVRYPALRRHIRRTAAHHRSAPVPSVRQRHRS